MRRMAMLMAAGTTCALVWATPALATFHETKVSEVALSRNGSTTEQFVELRDPGEPYPAGSGPYKLVVYGADGVRLGGQTLSNTTLAAVAPVRPILISTPAYDAAAGSTGDFALTVALPSAGQACFTAAGDTESRVHCMQWGTITTPLSGSGGSIAGPAPGDGQSLQTQCDGTAAVGAPTPGAANANIVPACTDSAPTAHFTFTPTNPTAGQTVTFDGSPSTDPDSGDHVASWQWTFDGETVTGSSPTTTRTFAAGVHTVSLTVLDSVGRASQAATTTISVAPAAGGGGGPAGGGAGTPPPPAVVCKVPKLKGLTLARAKRRLRAAHCRTGTIRRPRHAHGTLVVGKSSPRAGTKHAAGAKVKLTLVVKRRR